MKIDRIERLRDCRIFRDFAWPQGLKDFARLNLIYGWNGAGKTTLSTLLAGLEHGENRLGGECLLRVDGQTMDCTVPADRHPNLRVFNRDTVDRAVFEVPGTQLAPVYVIGEESVGTTLHIESLKSELEERRADDQDARNDIRKSEADLEDFYANHAREIRSLLATSEDGPYANYGKADLKAMIDSFGRQAPSRLSAEVRRAYLSQKDSRPKDRLAPLSQDYSILPDMTKAVDSLLKRSVKSTVIQQLAEDEELSNWVRKGLTLHEDHPESCKFCGQDLPEGLIQRLAAHYNREFNEFQGQVEGWVQTIRNLYDQIEVLEPPAKEQLYDHLAVDYAKHRASFMEKREDLLTYLDKMEHALEAKRARPFEVMDWNVIIAPDAVPDSEDGIMKVLMKVLLVGAANWGMYVGTDALKKLSADIEKHNRHTDNFEAEVAKARKALERDEAARLMPEYVNLETRIAIERQGIDGFKDEIAEVEAEIAELESKVRGQHSAAVALTADLASYLGRRELVFESKETGYTISRDGAPAMHLSEGERTAIAFLYFLRTLGDTSFDPARSTVVVDDPVSSLDSNSLYSAFGYMKEHLKDVAQVIVLTHDFTFFKLVKDWFHYTGKRGRDDRYYMLQPAVVGERRSATLAELDPLLSEYESEYHYLFKRVCQEAAVPEGQALASSYQMPNIARRLLEGFLAFRVPGSGSLHTRMGAIPFSEAKRARILRFVDVHSHHDRMPQAAHDPSILLQTRMIMNELLEFMEEADRPHCEAMRAATS